MQTKRYAAERLADLVGMFYRKEAQKDNRRKAIVATDDQSCDRCGCPRPGRHYTASDCNGPR